MRTYCTYFDSGYLSRGLALRDSLLREDPEARLVVYAADDATLQVLRPQATERFVIVPFEEAVTPAAAAVRPSRTRVEFLWTMTPVICEDVLARLHLDEVTYVDADVYFFGPPAELFAEMPGKSVLITEHRYTPKYDQTERRGRFCVQFVTFRATPVGLAVLRQWREDCLEWCHARPEPGRNGDQKYLDKWPAMSPEVHVSRHLGGGLGPWNIQQYRLHEAQGRLLCDHEPTGARDVRAVFYHFQGLRFLDARRVCMVPRYEIPDSARLLVYRPYVEQLLAIERDLRARFPLALRNEVAAKGAGWVELLRRAQVRLSANTHRISDLLAS